LTKNGGVKYSVDYQETCDVCGTSIHLGFAGLAGWEAPAAEVVDGVAIFGCVI